MQLEGVVGGCDAQFFTELEHAAVGFVVVNANQDHLANAPWSVRSKVGNPEAVENLYST